MHSEDVLRCLNNTFGVNLCSIKESLVKNTNNGVLGRPFAGVPTCKTILNLESLIFNRNYV
jgi:hypothetical protein